jgi:PAT family beta-lactamase induction signal transducer AmpG
MFVGSSALVFLAGKTNWLMGFGAAGAIMIVLGLGNGLFVPRVDESVPRDDAKAGAKAGARRVASYFSAFRSFFAQPHAPLVLAFIFCFKLGDLMTFAMSRPLLRDIGIDTAQRGLIATPQMLSHMAGALAGGWLISKYGLERCLAPMIYFMAIPLYIVIAWTEPSFSWVVVIVILEQFAGGMGSTAQIVYLMRRCRRAFSASHYAFASAVTAVGTTVVGAQSGHLNGALGHRWYFVACFLFSVPSMILVLFVPKAPLDPETPGS